MTPDESSRRHSVVAPASVVNVHAGAVSLPGDVGEAVIAAAGPVVSSVYVSLEIGPVFPTASVARTSKV